LYHTERQAQGFFSFVVLNIFGGRKGSQAVCRKKLFIDENKQIANLWLIFKAVSCRGAFLFPFFIAVGITY
jgi:hypothetical protein